MTKKFSFMANHAFAEGGTQNISSDELYSSSNHLRL